MNGRISLVLILLSLVLAGCAPSTPESSEESEATPPATATTAAESGPSPAGTVWRWTAVSGADALEVDAPDRYTLELLDNGRYHAQADCNVVGGSYELGAGRLRLEPGPMTLAACGPDSLDGEFVRLLYAVTTYARRGDRLTLEFADDAGAMTFEPMQHLALAGTPWKVRSYNNGKRAVISTVRDTALSATFGTEGDLTGSAGCNRFQATYEVDGTSIRIGPAAATKRACPGDGVMEQEAAFLAALSTAEVWEVRGKRLQLRTKDGSLVLDLFADEEAP